MDKIVNDQMADEDIKLYNGISIVEYLKEKLKDVKWN
jgi:hypothetical protein